MPPSSRGSRASCRAVIPTLLALLLPGALTAQVDIESLRRADAPDGTSGSLGADLTLTTGNVDFVQVDVAGRLNWVRGSTTTLLVGDGGLGFLDGDRFSSAGLVHLRRTHWLRDRIAPEWYTQVNYDRPQLLDFRALAGAGARFNLMEGDWGAVGAGTAIMFEYERLDLPAGARHDDETRTFRNSTFLTLRFVGGQGFVISSTAYVQPAFSDVFGDMRVLESLRVAAALTQSLALTVTFDLRYDSGQPDMISALDTSLGTGLSLTF